MSLVPPFVSSDLGTSEPTWLLDERWDRARVAQPADVLEGRTGVVVLAAHPDDESLGAGGLVAAAARAGLPVTVVVATAGEGSHPEATAWGAEDLRRVRVEEARAAVSRLTEVGPGAEPRLVQLDLADGEVSGQEERLVAAARAGVQPGTLLLAPYVADGHPDHEAVGRAAQRLAAGVGVDVWWYPIWLWHWGTGDDLPWERVRVVPLDDELLAAKRAGIDAHGSQVHPLGPAPGDAVLLGPHVRARFDRVVETYVVGGEGVGGDDRSPRSDRAATFDELLATGDPWGAGSWYERRKRALVGAALLSESYDRVLDIGCSTGELTAELAARAGEVVGVDVSGAALARARRLVPDAHVRWVLGEVPDVLGDEVVTSAPFDLVVVSEVGYFLTGDELLALLRRARRLLTDGGELLLCHWRHPTEGLPLDGTLVHAQARSALDVPHQVHHAEGDIILDVYGGSPPVPQVSR